MWNFIALAAYTLVSADQANSAKHGANKAYKAQADAQKYAADLQHEAAKAGLQAWKEQNERVRKDFTPYAQLGTEALAELREGWKAGRFDAGKWDGEKFIKEHGDIPKFEDTWDPEKFKEDPGYQFKIQEGEKAILRRSSAGSGANTGATLKALQTFGQDQASNEFGAARERALGDYNIKRQNYFGKRDNKIQDLQVNQELLNNEFNQLTGQVNIGMNANNAIAGNDRTAITEQVRLGNLGAGALGAGRIGQAQSQINNYLAKYKINQNNLDNVLGAGGLIFGAKK